MQCSIMIYYKKGNKVENKIFDTIWELNKCVNKINALSCKKEIWLDECYVSFEFKSEKGFNKALKILNPSV